MKILYIASIYWKIFDLKVYRILLSAGSIIVLINLLKPVESGDMHAPPGIFFNFQPRLLLMTKLSGFRRSPSVISACFPSSKWSLYFVVSVNMNTFAKACLRLQYYQETCKDFCRLIHSQDFFKGGGHTMSKWGYSPDCHFISPPVVGDLPKNGLQKWAPQGPPLCPCSWWCW